VVSPKIRLVVKLEVITGFVFRLTIVFVKYLDSIVIILRKFWMLNESLVPQSPTGLSVRGDPSLKENISLSQHVRSEVSENTHLTFTQNRARIKGFQRGMNPVRNSGTENCFNEK
jgi:hypothetical protein